MTQNDTNVLGKAGFFQMVKGSYQIRAEHEGYYPVNTSFNLSEGEVLEVDIRMDLIPPPPPPPESRVFGIVIDNATSIRMNGANITIFDLEEQSVVAYAMTNITGEYSITNVSAGNYSITASKWGYFLVPKNLTIPFNDSHVRVDFELVPDIPLPTVGNLTGYITDRDTGEPISGAYVITLVPYLLVQTDDDGLYYFRGLNEGSYLILAWIDGYVTEDRDIFIVAGMTKTLNITLGKEPGPPPPPTITGNVTDQKGNPIAGALVVRINSPYPFNGTTDENGHFRFENLSVGTYVFKVHADGYMSNMSTPVNVSWNETRDINVTLKKMKDLKPPDNRGFILEGIAADIFMVLMVSLIFVVVIMIAYVMGKRFRGKRAHEPTPEPKGTDDEDDKAAEETPTISDEGPKKEEGVVEKDRTEEE